MKHHAISLHRVIRLRGWKVRMRAYTSCTCRNARSKWLGHSDNLALLRRTGTHDRGPSMEKCIEKTSRQRYHSTCGAYDHYYTALFIVRHWTVELAMRFRFAFFILPWKPSINAEGIRSYVSLPTLQHQKTAIRCVLYLYLLYDNNKLFWLFWLFVTFINL